MSARAAVEAITATWQGRTLTLREWSRVRSVYLLGITVRTMRDRLAMGWDVERVFTTPGTLRMTRGPCVACGTPTERPGSIASHRLRCDACHGLHAADSASTLRYCDDPAAQEFVKNHPDGATHAEIGEFLGISAERVRQIQDQVFRTIGGRCALVGIEAGANPPQRRTKPRPAAPAEDVESEEDDAEVEEAAPGCDALSDLSQRVEALLADIVPSANRLDAITKRAVEIEP